MNIRIKATGRPFLNFPSDIAQAFIDAGLAEQFAPKETSSTAVAALPKVPTFALVRNEMKPMHSRWEIVLTTPGGNVVRFDGPLQINPIDIKPEKVRDAFKSLAWSPTEQRQTLQGPEVPEHTVKDYIAARIREASIMQTNAERIRDAQR
jgi:hypothetical protein